MRVRIQVIVESEAGAPPVVQEGATLERGPLQAEGLGLTLAEAKGLLRGVQEAMVARQAAEFVARHEGCPDCGKARPRKGRHEIAYRTLFGKLRLDSPRVYECPCRGPARASVSPWPSGSPSGRPRSWPTWRPSSRRWSRMGSRWTCSPRSCPWAPS